MITDQVTENEAITDKGEEREDGPYPWPTTDEAILQHVKDRRKASEEALSTWYDDARIDFQFGEGKQWADEDVEKLEGENRIAATFNRCAPIINAILGQEVCNRQEVRYLPRRIGEVNAADPMNDAVKWCRESCNAEDEDSDAFSDMVTCGMGWTVTRMEYERTPEGMPDVQRRDPMLMRWDTSARRKNLADARWVQADYWMDKDSVEDKWPDKDIESAVNLNPDDKKTPHDSTEAWKYKNDAHGQDQYDDELRVIHHVEHFAVRRYKMVDPASGTERDYSEQEYKQLKTNAETAKVDLPQCAKTTTRVYWQAWTVGAVVLESGVQAAQKDFCYQAMTCYRERETGFWYGVIRMMRDPQRYANRLMSLMMSILATGPKGGMLYETGAFANPKKAKQDWAKFDSAIEVTPGRLDSVKPKEPQVMPQGAADLMQFAVTSIRDVTGVNVDMLGGADRDQPGIVEDMRTKSGLTILAKVFDALRLYRKRQGVLLAEFVDRFISDGRLIRILGKEGEQFIPLLRRDAVEYDVVVDESPAARDVKERTWIALQQIVPLAMQSGMAMPPSLLDHAPIPQSLAMEWKKAIAEQKAQPPQSPPIVEAEKIKAQATLQVQQAKLQADSAIAQGKLAAEAQIAQIKAQSDAHFEQLKAQKAIISEQAQMQADMMVQQMKADMQAHMEQMKIAYQMQLEDMKNSREQETKIATTRIQAMASIEVARIGAGADSGDAVESRLQALSLPGMDGVNAIVNSQASVSHDLNRHEQMLGQLGNAVLALHKTVAAPRKLVRDAKGKAVGSVVDHGTVQ